MQIISSNKSFGGWHNRYRHPSKVLDCLMQFAVYLPPQAEQGARLPVLYWLSGLTCSDENFMQKAGAQRIASALGLILVAPDTSPRGALVADDPQGAYDLGQGAGFYINATQEPWAKHYRMYDYVTQELPDLIESNFKVSGKRGISGHSMGGHGALISYLKNPGRYHSVSAFAPIANPMNCPWGQKAFSAYLGPDQDAWRAWDACELLAQAQERLPILIDQGVADDFLQEQLKPHVLQQVAQSIHYPLTVRMQPGYDHSYYFIASFIEEHLKHHAHYLLP